jgi:hypothetical protein
VAGLDQFVGRGESGKSRTRYEDSFRRATRANGCG